MAIDPKRVHAMIDLIIPALQAGVSGLPFLGPGVSHVLDGVRDACGYDACWQMLMAVLERGCQACPDVAEQAGLVEPGERASGQSSIWGG